MAEINHKSSSDEIKPAEEEREETKTLLEAKAQVEEAQPQSQHTGGSGGGWSGWGFSPFSYLSDLQKTAAVAAEEISRSAVEVAKTVAKSITTIQDDAEDSESSKGEDKGEPEAEAETEDENDKRCKAALDKLERASKDSFLSQDQEIDEEIMNIDWPEDSAGRAKIICTMHKGTINEWKCGSSISDVAEAYVAAIKKAIKKATIDSHDNPQKSVQEKASTFSDNLRADHSIAVSKIQDGLQFLSYVVLSTSMPVA